ncbi:MAG: TonB family protein [Caulobacteraceae bacterium]
MVIQQNPGLNPLASLLEGRERSKMSRGAMIALGGAALLHLGLAVYIYQTKFSTGAADIVEPPVVTIGTYRLPEAKPEPVKATKTPPQTSRVRAPVQTPVTPPTMIDAKPIKDVPPITVTNPATLETVAGDAVVAEQVKPSVIAQPRWVKRPSAEQMDAAFPIRARNLGVSGKATLGCTVTASGGVTGCAVVSETPGYGFGDAAMRLSKYFRMSPQTRDGTPVEGAKVSIPISFAVS